MAEHTQTPWEFTAYAHLDNAAGVVECTKDVRKTGRVVAFIRSGPNMPPAEVLPNARFVVRAVNCHEELVAALEAWLSDHEECETGHIPDELDEEGCLYCDRILWTRNLLAKAKANTAHEARLRQRDLDEETL